MSVTARARRLLLLVLLCGLLPARLVSSAPAWVAVNAGARAWRERVVPAAGAAAPSTSRLPPDSLFRSATRLLPTSATAWRDLGRVQLAAGQDAQAAVSLQHATQLNPADRLSHLELARAYTSLGIEDAAQTQWQLGGWPAYLSLRHQAQDALDNGQPERAAQAADLALAVQPEQAQAYYLLGEAAWAVGQPQTAASAWRRGETRVSGPPTALDLYYQARVALLDGQPARAATGLREALRLDATLPWGEFWLGEALAAVGETTGAREAFLKHVKRYPANAWGFVRLGDLARGQGLDGEARMWYQRGLAVDPGNIAAAQGLATLERPASTGN